MFFLAEDQCPNLKTWLKLYETICRPQISVYLKILKFWMLGEPVEKSTRDGFRMLWRMILTIDSSNQDGCPDPKGY